MGKRAEKRLSQPFLDLKGNFPQFTGAANREKRDFMG